MIRGPLSSRDARTELCGEAHAPIRDPRGRVRKYASASASSTAETRPSTRTCRPSTGQWKTSAARGFAASSRPFRLSRFVKNAKPRSSTPFSSTARAEGAPSAEAVARTIVSGSRAPASSASRNHVRNCATGSAATSSSRSGSKSGTAAPYGLYGIVTAR